MNKKMILGLLAGSVLLTNVTMTAYADLTPVTSSFSVQEQMQGGWGMQRGGSGRGGMQNGGMMPNNGQMGGRMGGQMGSNQNVVSEPGVIVKSDAVNTAAALESDMANAAYITMSDENNEVKIDAAGTYVISGSASNGSITVKKGTTGVVLVLEDLDLTGTAGAPLSINKESEVKVVISGTVTLTDAENLADENSADPAVADVYDGAAVKVKANSMVYITGDGTLNLIGKAKNGIKGGDEASLILDGPAVQIAAVNDGINVNYDLTILSGSVAVNAADDGIHADHILTVGSEGGTGPVVYIAQCKEGLEGTVVNIFSGDITVNASDDAINGAFKDETLKASVNMTGGNLTITSQGDGIDCNGNINLIGGSATLNVQYRMGDAGIDYDGAYYVSADFQMNNPGGVAGPDRM